MMLALTPIGILAHQNWEWFPGTGKYLAFRKWLYTPCSSSDVRWARIPRVLKNGETRNQPTKEMVAKQSLPELVDERIQKDLRGGPRKTSYKL